MRRRFVAMLVVALVGCAPSRLVAPLRYEGSAPLPDAPFRASAPPRVEVAGRVDDAPRVTVLANGMRVLLVERHDFPYVAARLVVDRGALDLGDAASGQVGQLLSLFARGGSEGAGNAVQDEEARSGVSAAAEASGSSLSFGSYGPARELDAALDVLARLTFAARLAPEEHAQREASWVRSQEEGRVSTMKVARFVLFGEGSAYGYAGHTLPMMALDAATSLHERLFQPAHATLVVVGDTSPAEVDAAAARAFGAWVDSSPLARRTDAPPPMSRLRLTMVSRRGYAQTQGLVFARGPLPTSDDRFPLLVAAKVLGGGRSSKLMEELRDETQALYGGGTALYSERTASVFAFGGSFNGERVVEGVSAVLAGVRRLREGRVTDEEIDAAREPLLAAHRQIMATVWGASREYAEAVRLGCPLDSVGDFPKRLAAVSRESLEAAANRYLTDDALHVTLMGDDRWLDTRELGLGGW